MSFNTGDFDYHLPVSHIAQVPIVPREAARLMVVDRKTGTITHTYVAHFPDYLHQGDVLVINNTKVFHARLKSGNKELFLVRTIGGNRWQAIGKKLIPGETIVFAQDFRATILEKHNNGTVVVEFGQGDVIALANKYGEVPVPPYIKTIPKDADYQTAYAKIIGSVAAPTAGFHLTKALLQTIKNRGVEIVEITLHVGLGTFLPIKTASLEAHPMHSEWVEIKPDAAEAIKRAKRVVAVGTTTVRALEGTGGKPYMGDINLFIKPEYKFCVVDGMLTNFHLPKSTLIVLVSAFADRKLILHAYKEAIEHGYRFYSFGDAMFLA
ncbi:tRNA preQ1(34) S-adenosylmethionine ribosyltransferase-isomerase QueA [Candidatus Gottesmanbacteria bacterium RIFOXYB1_FULL_47_11]|uniref:S-adenosylmethionine:tRNA ribosyltransferase-isomerase n=1 Tax=Candidatus Gottesmanbacteria bacterium RIFOXYB1_FULL_47_11 TaxID=1798401 RepID=A0A1F6BDR9_9BACT|nr:MAG: tRNA preQ1(34) S-adenosylmethionine ribosyltransferase-isomerase QueA [Candidatus Gottesmanbacteria bacterium RIFOXYB1_FULL_47_11]